MVVIEAFELVDNEGEFGGECGEEGAKLELEVDLELTGKIVAGDRAKEDGRGSGRCHRGDQSFGGGDLEVLEEHGFVILGFGGFVPEDGVVEEMGCNGGAFGVWREREKGVVVVGGNKDDCRMNRRTRRCFDSCGQFVFGVFFLVMDSCTFYPISKTG